MEMEERLAEQDLRCAQSISVQHTTDAPLTPFCHEVGVQVGLENF